MAKKGPKPAGKAVQVLVRCKIKTRRMDYEQLPRLLYLFV